MLYREKPPKGRKRRQHRQLTRRQIRKATGLPKAIAKAELKLGELTEIKVNIIMYIREWCMDKKKKDQLQGVKINPG